MKTKKRSKWARILAVMLALTMVFCDQSVLYASDSMADPVAVEAVAEPQTEEPVAEPVVETPAPQAEVQPQIQMETEAPAPVQTEAPAPAVVETEAPAVIATEASVPAETEAPAPAQTEVPTVVETEAPAPETEAPAPVTEAPAPAETEIIQPAETEAPAPAETEAPVHMDEPAPAETEVPETEAPVPAETEAPAPVETEAPTETETEPATEPQTEAALKTFAMMMAISVQAGETLTVTRSVAGKEKTITIPVGVFASIVDKEITVDGQTYEYQYAALKKNTDDEAITKLHAVAVYEGKIYVTTEAGQISGVEVGAGTDIVLYYKKKIDSFSVNYKVLVNNKEVDVTNGIAQTGNIVHTRIVGVSEIDSGETLNVAFAKKEGYTVDKVTYAMGNDSTETTVTEDSGKYSVKQVTGDVTFRIYLKTKDKYNISFKGSNTQFTFNEEPPFVSGYSGGTHGIKTVKTYTPGASLSFDLKGYDEWDVASRALNKLTITISGAVTKIGIPTGAGTETTTLPNGITVTVTRTEGGKLPAYKVTMTAASGNMINGDIEVDTNFKNITSKEVWAVNLIGVEPLHYWDGSGWDQNQSGDEEVGKEAPLNPALFVYGKRSDNKDFYVYIKIADDYKKDTKPSLSVICDGVVKTFELRKVPSNGNNNGMSQARKAGCQYYFVIRSSETATDIRISVVAERKSLKFGARYDYNDGINENDPNSKEFVDPTAYAVGDTIKIQDIKLVQNGFVFTGWELKNNTDLLKKDSPVSVLAEDAEEGGRATRNSQTDVYEYIFVAKWEKEEDFGRYPYAINVYFDGTQKWTTIEYGPSERNAYVNLLNIKGIVNTKEIKEALGLEEADDLWDYYEVDSARTNTSTAITKKGQPSINIHFKHKILTVTANNAEYIYNGTLQGEDGVTTKGLASGHHVKDVDISGEEIDAGTYNGALVPSNVVIYDTAEKNVTSKYGKYINYVAGNLKITPRTVKLTSKSATKPYDGTPLTRPDVTVEGEGFVNDEATAIATGEALNVGDSVTNTIEVKPGDGYKEENYAIEKFEGTLTITANEKAIVITAADGSWMYNGAAHSNATYTVSYDGTEIEVNTEGKYILPTGDEVTAKVVGSVTNVEDTVTGNNKIAEYVVENSDNYSSIQAVNGTLTITPRTVKLTSESATKPYDGTPLTRPDVSIENEGFVNDEATAIATGEALNVGDSVTNTIEVRPGNGYKETNYTIQKFEGTLTITASEKAIVIKAVSDSWMYDGNAHSNDAYTVIYDGTEIEANEEAKYILPTGDEVTAKVVGSVTNVEDTAVGNNKIIEYTVENKDNYNSIQIENGTLSITPRTIKLTSESASKPYDSTPLTNHDITVSGDGWAEGEGADYNVTGSQTYVGSSKNYFDYTLYGDSKVEVQSAEAEKVPTKASNYEITKVYGTLTVTDEGVTDVVTKTHDGKSYGLNDTIIFTITVVNIYDAPQDITINEQEGVTITGESEFKGVQPGETATTTAEYTITEEDILKNSFKNTATATFSNGKDHKGTDEVIPDDPTPSLLVEKKADQKEGGYRLNDEVTYTITVTNNGNVTMRNIIVNDDLTKLTKTIDSLAPGVSKSFKTTYTVTEADILAGTIINVATATGMTPDKEYIEAKDSETIDIETKNGHLTVTKTTTSTPKNGETYALGETISYDITVTNDGNLTITEIEVSDALTRNTGENAWKIDSLAPGTSETFTTSYTVTEKDILAGSVLNEATAKGKTPDPENPDVPVDPGKTEDPTDPKNGHLTVTKTTTSTPKNGETYALGETISYDITVTNDGNLTITDIEVSDALTRNTGENAWKIDSLAPGTSETFTTSYTVTEKDILAGKVVNEATAKGTSPDPDNPDVPVDPGKTEDPTDPKNGHLNVTKTTTSTPANGSAYALGETISYEITVTNDGNLTITAIEVTDALTGNTGDDAWHIDSLAPGESETFTTSYTVTEKDILAGKVVNEATAKGTSPDPEKPEVPVDPGETEDPTDPKNGHLTVTKTTTSTPKNGKTYALGETISYEITVTNDGNLTITAIEVTDDLTENTGENAWHIDSLAPGTSETFTTSYTVTETDILAGKVVNEATAKGTSPDPEKPDVPVEPGKTEDPTDPAKTRLQVVKETISTPADGKTAYALGETIEYKLTVTNTGNLTVENVKVLDELTGNIGDNALVVEGSLAPGKSAVFYASYTVTEKDILAGKVVNEATATGTSTNPKDPDVPVDPGKTEDPTDPAKVHLTVTKETTSTPANGETYALGETISYRIIVKNTGNLTVKDIEVTDALTGNTGSNAWHIDTLTPGEIATFTTSYTVTEKDILAGKVVNEATAKGTSPDPENPDVPVDPGKTEDPTDPKNGHLNVTKTTTSTPANGSAYALGETIRYEITVTNDGNLTITAIEVTDALTGNTGDHAWHIDSLAPGESKTFKASYTVVEKDLLAGEVHNEATAKGTSPDPEKPDVPVDPGTKDDPTVKAEPSLFVDKEANQKAGGYALGEEVTYTIRVLNNGNVTISNITVTDEMTGLNETIPTLAVGEEKTFTTTHKVTEEDILKGKILNVATAKGTDPSGNPVEKEDSKEIDTEPKNAHVTVTKTTTGAPADGTAYTIGEKITYQITVTNDGNLTAKDLTVTDELTGNTGDKAWKIETLAPGESRTFTAEYTVTEADAQAGKVINVATAAGKSPDPEKPEIPTTPGTNEVPAQDGSGSIQITKHLTLDGETVTAKGATFYVALYEDEAATVKLTEEKALTYDGTSSATVTFDHIVIGKTYYLSETDGNGNAITSGNIDGNLYMADFTDGRSITVHETKGSAALAFTNVFMSLPDNFYKDARLTITKKLLDADGKAKKSNETFYIGLFADAAHTQLTDRTTDNLVALNLNGDSEASATVSIVVSPITPATLYIAEVDEDGIPVDDGFAYDVTIDNTEITLTETDSTASVVITNQEKADEPEEPTEKPTETEPQTAKTTEKPADKTTTAPKTGDDTNIWFYVTLMMLAVLAGTGYTVRRKRRAK